MDKQFEQNQHEAALLRGEARRRAFEAAHTAALAAAEKRNAEPAVVALEVMVAMLVVGEALVRAQRSGKPETAEDVQTDERVKALMASVGLPSKVSRQTLRAASLTGLLPLLRLQGSSVSGALEQPRAQGLAGRLLQSGRQWLVRKLS